MALLLRRPSSAGARHRQGRTSPAAPDGACPRGLHLDHACAPAFDGSYGEPGSIKISLTQVSTVSGESRFKRVCKASGAGESWTPRELRTSFVSLMSHNGVSTEEIARLVGHASTRTTEIVYRRELRPVITTGAEIMHKVFRAS